MMGARGVHQTNANVRRLGHPLLFALVLASMLLATACSAGQSGSPSPAATTATHRAAPPSPTLPASPSSTVTLAPTQTLLPAEPSAKPSSVATVSSLTATVTAGLLSCRYGPGPNYLFLYGLRQGANIVLIGRTDADNWHWVYVQGSNKCWVNINFLQIAGDWKRLPVVYPGIARLPVSPYYPPTSVLSVVRKDTLVTVEWLDVPLRAGDEEDERMQHYIVEVWRCQDGVLLFEPLATNELSVTFTDPPGCSASHGRILVQEKHGFAGPTEIPWPPFQ